MLRFESMSRGIPRLKIFVKMVTRSINTRNFVDFNFMAKKIPFSLKEEYLFLALFIYHIWRHG